jgi:uridine phosphorylase
LNEDEAIFTSHDTIRYVAKNRRVPPHAMRIPKRLLLTYQRNAYESAKKLIDGTCIEWLYGEAQPFCVGRYDDVEIGVGRFWIGAPATVMTLEEAIACGANTIFEVGISGGLQTFLKPADLIVVTEAIRDEGTSNHYLPPKVKVESSKHLRAKLVGHLKQAGIRHFIGPVCSTDGVYRETRGKLRKFRNNGVLAINMETSAVFALAKYRDVEAVSAQVISDLLTENGWHQAFHDRAVKQNTVTLLRAALDTLSEA